jgi:hypothetical protein
VKVALSAFFIAEVAHLVLGVKGRRMGGGGPVVQACGAAVEESRGGPTPERSPGAAACGRRACGEGGVGCSK